MPPESEYSDTPGRTDADAMESGATAPTRIGAPERKQSRDGADDGSRHVRHRRVRVVALEAEVALLEAQRAALVERVVDLESEVDSLERAVEWQEQQRQQVIDNYEAIIAEKEEAYRARREGSGETTGTAGTRPLSSAHSRIEVAISRLKRLSDR